MCNLYRMTKSASEVANLFSVSEGQNSNAGGEVYPGYPGMVIADGAVETMTWGFPLSLKGKSGQVLKPRPVNNTRSDKLDSQMWSASFQERRCVIPVEAFAEAEGQKGSKTRTWFSDPDGDILGCAGIWRNSAEWGACYSMVMTDANATVRPVHGRMPVLLAERDWTSWTDGLAGKARALCVPFAGALAVERTDQPWNAR